MIRQFSRSGAWRVFPPEEVPSSAERGWPASARPMLFLVVRLRLISKKKAQPMVILSPSRLFSGNAMQSESRFPAAAL